MLWHSVVTHPHIRYYLDSHASRQTVLTCSACDLFLAPPRGMAPLAITQPRATADTGTSCAFAIPLITSSRGSSCSMGMFENFRPDGGGLAAEYLPVRRPMARGESVVLADISRANIEQTGRVRAHMQDKRCLSPSCTAASHS
jgi:hypothetical protein